MSHHQSGIFLVSFPAGGNGNCFFDVRGFVLSAICCWLLSPSFLVFLVFWGVFFVFLCFWCFCATVCVFVCFFAFRASARFFFSGGEMRKTGNSRSVSHRHIPPLHPTSPPRLFGKCTRFSSVPDTFTYYKAIPFTPLWLWHGGPSPSTHTYMVP